MNPKMFDHIVRYLRSEGEWNPSCLSDEEDKKLFEDELNYWMLNKRIFAPNFDQKYLKISCSDHQFDDADTS